MKKALAMAVAAGVVMSTACTVFAAEETTNPYDFKFDGSITFQQRVQRDENNSSGVADNTKTGLKTTFVLNMDKPLAKNLDLYARATYQTYNVGTSQNGADFFRDTVKEDYNGAIDTYGLKYSNAGYTYTVGKQILTIGNGLIYDNGYIGRHAVPNAIKIDTKAGATNLSLIAAKTDYGQGQDNDKFYAVQGNYDLSSKANIGAVYAHVSYGDATLAGFNLPYSSANFYGVNGSYKFTDKWSASAEFVKSDGDDDNTGYITGVSYKMDAKNTVGAGYFRVEDQVGIVDNGLANMTTAPYNNARGFNVYWKNQINKYMALTVADFQYDKINENTYFGGAGSDRQRFTTTLAIVF